MNLLEFPEETEIKVHSSVYLQEIEEGRRVDRAEFIELHIQTKKEYQSDFSTRKIGST